MRAMILAGLAALAVLAAGCGGGSDDGTTAAMKEHDAMKSENAAMKDDGAMKDDDAMMSSGKSRTIKVVGSDYGRVVADAKGEAFYLFDKESGPKSECYGACAQAWPPVLTSGKPHAVSGAKAALLGTTKRKDGKVQVTYAGHPLYYFSKDSPGNILCQDVEEFGGTWLVVKPSGAPVT